MLKRIQLIGYLGLAWVVLFQCTRFLFFCYQYLHHSPQPFSLFIDSAWHGLRMDLSFAAYLLLVPTLLVSVTATTWGWYRHFLNGYSALVSFCIASIVTSDLEVYKAWGFRLDMSPLRYLSNPKEAYASLSSSPLDILVLIFILLLGLILAQNHFIVKTQIPNWEKSSPLVTPPLFLFFTATLVIPIRGGLQLAPMNQSAVYYSSNNFANQLAVNPSWNFFRSLLYDNRRTDNPYQYMSRREATHILNNLQNKSQSKSQIALTHPSPNVLLIVWESFTAKVVSSLGGVAGVTPRFDSLRREGLFFTNIYASGDRSDKGLVALLSGYPAQPITSIITHPTKTATLPSLPKFFKSKAYNTSFYYGGESEFANIKSYLLQHSFDRIIDKKSFRSKDMNSKWGAHDHVVFDRLLSDLDKEATPFFTTLFTLSSHEPFEVPVETVIPGKDNEHKFLNSHHYTDASLGAFIDKAKTKPWWKNTLVIIIADHGHPLPHLNDEKPSQFHIPMLWVGGALPAQGTTIDTLGSQTDLVATLLNQLGHDSGEFKWSNNLMARHRTPYAFYSFNNGFGWMKPGGYVVYDNVGHVEIVKKGAIQPRDTRQGMAYLQTLFDDFLRR